MLDGLGLRRTKWKRLSLNTNVTAILQCPPCHEITPIPSSEQSSCGSVREEERGSLNGNIDPNSEVKKPAYGSHRKIMCLRCRQAILITGNIIENIVCPACQYQNRLHFWSVSSLTFSLRPDSN